MSLMAAGVSDVNWSVIGNNMLKLITFENGVITYHNASDISSL
jgi:hypothetical protein